MTQPAETPDYILNSGEKVIAEFRADKGVYWRAHGVMAVAFMALTGFVLWLTDTPHIAIGSLGAVLAVGVRAAYLASEALGFVFTLTNQRLIFPGGERAVPLMSIETVRSFFGSVQIITASGDKHLLRYSADPSDVIAQITDARTKRANRRG